MEGFEWDSAKAKANLKKHGIDFADAALVFEDATRVEWLDEREQHREERLCTVGEVHDIVILVAYTMRGDRIRLITARHASKREREEYHGNREI